MKDMYPVDQWEVISLKIDVTQYASDQLAPVIHNRNLDRNLLLPTAKHDFAIKEDSEPAS
jgi:hypothetical protein